MFERSRASILLLVLFRLLFSLHVNPPFIIHSVLYQKWIKYTAHINVSEMENDDDPNVGGIYRALRVDFIRKFLQIAENSPNE